MQGLRRLVSGLAVFLVGCFVLSACAVLQPDDRVRAQVRDVGFAKAGDVVHMYYGMPKAAKEEFCPGTVVTVYRYPARDWYGEIYHSKYEVGTIQITRNLDNRFVEAKVLDGLIRTGDIAMKSNTTCFVQASRM